jgi:hypothetical protein
MRTPRAIILAFSLILLLVAVAHTMGRLIYADTVAPYGVHFGYTSLVEVVLMFAFAVLCVVAPNGPAPASRWIRPVKLALCGLLLFGAGFHLVGGEQQNLAAQLGVSGPLMAQATFYDDAGHWLFAAVVSCLMALMGYQEVIDPARPWLTVGQRAVIVAEGFLLAAGASLSVIIAQSALLFALCCAAGWLLLAWRRPLRSPLAAYVSTFFAFSLLFVSLWNLLPASVRAGVLDAYVP